MLLMLGEDGYTGRPYRLSMILIPLPCRREKRVIRCSRVCFVLSKDPNDLGKKQKELQILSRFCEQAH